MVNQGYPTSTERPARDLIGTTRPKEHGQESKFLDVVALIRSIQKAERNEVCFRTGRAACGQIDCAWRNYCLKTDWRPKSAYPSGLVRQSFTPR